MLELLPYDVAFSRLTIPHELEYLAFAGKQLLDTAHEENSLYVDEQNGHFKHFIDRPEAVQSLWQVEEPHGFYPSEWLAVNIVRDALILSIRSRAASEDTNTLPAISAVIGNGYTRLSENNPSRAAHYDYELTDKHLDRFIDRLYESTAIMGIQHVLQGKQAGEEAIAA